MVEEAEVSKMAIPGFDIPLEELYQRLETDPKKGLVDTVVERRLAQFGLNEVPKVKPSIFSVYIAPLLEVMIVVYLIMAGFLVVLTIWESNLLLQAGQWVAIVAINFVIAIIQQSRASKKMDALQKLSAATARVIRNEKTLELETEDLVPGDLIQLTQGDSIPADARIINSTNFIVNEASLTGESVPINKLEDGSKVLNRDTPIGERGTMIYKGTFVQIGNADAIVVNTGKNTEIGKISSDLADMSTGEIPLRAKVNTLGKYLSVAVIFFLIIQLVYRYIILMGDDELNNTSKVVENIAASIVTAMSLMPINIPLLTTIVLITGVLAMATHRVVIRNLAAVESLGRISILCSDKTGTITRSQMTVKRVWDGKRLFGVTGLGYGPNGVIFPTPMEVKANLDETNVPTELNVSPEGSTIELMLISGFMNNEAELIVEDVFEATGQTSWKATGSPTDAALKALFSKSGLDKTAMLMRYNEERSYPFDSSIKRMSKIVHDQETGDYLVFTKGAIEILLDKCVKIGNRTAATNLTPEKKKEIHGIANSFAGLGFRVLTLCFKPLSSLPPKNDKERDAVESDLILLGFVCLLDPPREGVKDAVEECLSAGITPIMITGDSPVTAATIAREVSIINRDDQLTHEGKMAGILTDDEFFRTTVFARVAPKDKQIIVERYQKRGNIVAMTGDGVNDALALSMADAGICMGITGTDVAKQAADLVIADDSFISIVTGIREGRGLFMKIRMMIFFYIGVNLAEAMLYFGTSFIPGFSLFNTWQRIYIFSIAHFLPPMGIIFDKISGDIMERKPLDGAGIFNKRLGIALLLMAATLSLGGYVAFLLVFNPFDFDATTILQVTGINQGGITPIIDANDLLAAKSWSHAKARTMLHTTLYISESFLVFSMRRMDMSIFESTLGKEERSYFVWLAVLSLPVFHVGMMYLTPVQDLLASLSVNFEIIPLDLVDWLICIPLGLLPVLVLELYKLNTRKKGQFF